MRMISFVIPCYNSEKYIEKTIDELMSTIKNNLSNYKTEILLINDSSKDNTIGKIKDISKKITEIKIIDLAKNFGQHSAIMAGLKFSKGDIIVCMDDDGQTPPNEVEKLINALDCNTDVVYAKYKNKKHSYFRNLGSKINDSMAQSLLSKPKNLYISSYFCMKKYVKDEILLYNNPYPYLEGLVLRTTNKIKNVEVDHREREIGKTNYSIKKLLKLWLNGFTNFSVKPLRIAIVFSMIFAIIAILITTIVIINKLNNPNVPIGWSSVIVLLLIIGAAITFILGLIGEYIGRIYLSINNNPQYVIREVYENEK